jgi:L-fuconolactonase
MLIVDSQVHLERPGHSKWKAMPEGGLTLEERVKEFEGWEGKKSFLPNARHPDLADLLSEMGKAGVDAVAIVPRSRQGELADEHHLAALEAARQYPEKFGIMARLDPGKPETAGRLDEFAAAPEVIGVRLSIHTRHNKGEGNTHLLTGGGAEWVFEGCEAHQLPLMLFAPNNVDAVGAVAKAHPDLRIVCDHLLIDVDEMLDDPQAKVQPLLKLAKYDNVAVKASALPAVVKESYPFPKLKEALRDVIGAFGSERVFWGSDVSRIPVTYGMLVRFWLEELDFLTDTERANVMGAGLVRWLRWSALEPRVTEPVAG